MWQILLPKDTGGQEIAIYVKMVMKGLRDSEKTFKKKWILMSSKDSTNKGDSKTKKLSSGNEHGMIEMRILQNCQ